VAIDEFNISAFLVSHTFCSWSQKKRHLAYSWALRFATNRRWAFQHSAPPTDLRWRSILFDLSHMQPSTWKPAALAW